MRRLLRFQHVILISLLFIFFFCTPATFAENTESFTGPKLPADWKEQLGPGSAGSVSPSADGLLIKSESKVCAFVARENSADGSDERPLVISAFVRTQDGCDPNLASGVHFYWDNDNFCSLQVADQRALRCCWMSNGVFGESITPPLLRDIKLTQKPFSSEAYVRLVLLTHSVVFYASTNGAHWYRLMDIERKATAAKKGPSKIILGRAYSGNAYDKPANPGMANNVPGTSTKPLYSALVREVALTQSPAGGAVAPLELEKKDAWELSLASALAAGIPRKWSVLGPLNAEHSAKLLAPDLTDDWNAALKAPDGKPIKVPEPPTWQRPEDDNGSYVDMPSAMNGASGLQWAKTDVNWPVTGEALLWYDSIDPIIVFVNNVSSRQRSGASHVAAAHSKGPSLRCRAVE